MSVKFFPELGHLFQGAFGEISEHNSSGAPEDYFERSNFLSATISIKEVKTSSHYLVSSQQGKSKAHKGHETSTGRIRRIEGTGKIVEDDNPYRHYVASLSPLGSKNEFTSVSIEIVDDGSNTDEVKFYCSDFASQDNSLVLRGASLEVKVPSTRFEQVLSDLKTEKYLMRVHLDLSQCAGCVAAWSVMPGGEVKLKFLSHYTDLENPKELPADFFEGKELGSGASLQITFDNSTKRTTKFLSANQPPVTDPVIAKSSASEIDLAHFQNLPLILTEIALQVKNVGTKIAFYSLILTVVTSIALTMALLSIFYR